MDLLRSLPIGLYLEKPLTWLHLLDSRVKLIWLMSLLLANRSSSPEWLLVLVGFLVVLTVVVNIPLRVWKQQMGWLLIISFLVFLIIALSPDGLAISSQPRLPINNILNVHLLMNLNFHFLIYILIPQSHLHHKRNSHNSYNHQNHHNPTS